MRIALAQIDATVGDVAGNAGRILARLAEAQRAGAHLIATPELALAGYPPEDLLFHRGFRRRIEESLARLADAARGIDLLVGYPEYVEGAIFNAAAWLRDGRRIGNYRKQRLPNYQVFDDKRYFTPGDTNIAVELGGIRVAPIICEDVWHPEVVDGARRVGADVVISINASPYQRGKQAEREAMLAARARENGLPLVYLNHVGGQDEVVYDGCSFAVDAGGRLVHRAPAFEESLTCVDVVEADRGFDLEPESLAPLPEREESVWRAIVLGVRDYVDKHRFEGVVIGLSGGVDSALVAAMATDALGPERVHCVMLPYRYTSNESLSDAAACAEALGVRYETIPIADPVEGFLKVLAKPFAGVKPDITEENIQSRVRGSLLMAISNKFGAMVLTTGNKSEMSVGYATLYGDMNGGFNPIKDLYKMEVYALCRWRNRHVPKGAKGPPGIVIPENILTKAPTAELRENQKDQDSLPEYEVLDDILKCLVEDEMPLADIIARGHAPEVVKKVERLLYLAEYKRRQAAPGVKISARNFGRDRRYPITNRFREDIGGR